MVLSGLTGSWRKLRVCRTSGLEWLWVVWGGSAVVLCGLGCVRSGVERVEWFRVGLRWSCGGFEVVLRRGARGARCGLE